MQLSHVLRIAAALVLCGGISQFLLMDVFEPAPFAVACVLVTLSFTLASRERPSVLIALGMSLLIPVGAAASALHGEIPFYVAVFDILVFGWVFYSTRRAFNAYGAARAGIAPPASPHPTEETGNDS